MCPRPLGAQSTVRDAVEALLHAVLPARFHTRIPGLLSDVLAHPQIASLAARSWISLSAAERMRASLGK